MEPTSVAQAMEWSIQLEMGLRSTKPGVPVKAISDMEPRLQQWSTEPEFGIAPYAMFGLVPGEDKLFANTILLRLVDAFRGGDIETKLSVVRVFLSERKHRDKEKKKQCKGLLSEAKVANHLELLKRVKSVFDSGELKSKALALVLFGCWADFVKDNAQIRYLIFSSLVSPHDCEVRASLYATGCICEISDDFASISVEMLFNIMNSSSVPLPIKLDAAQVLAKCKSSYSVAYKAYKTGMELVLNSSDEEFLVAMLFSLSKLACILIPCISYQVLLSIPPSSLHKELREFVRLLTVVENASQYPTSRKRCLSIRILADLCCRMKDIADIDEVFCCSLPSRVISLIKDHIKLLLKTLLEGCQNDLTIFQELQGLLKILLNIVERHPNLGSLVLDSLKQVIEYLVTVASTNCAVPSTLLTINFTEEKNSFILKLFCKIYRFLVAFLENFYIVGAINTKVFSEVNILVGLVCQCSLIDCYTYTLYHLLLHSQPICDGLVHEIDETHLASCCTMFVNKVLTGTNDWTAYKVGAHAACQGEWLLATNIFRTLIEKVKSDSCCSWLKALFHYAHSEGKIQLLSQPKQGTTSMELMETIKFPITSCDYKGDTCPRLARSINDCNYYDQLTQSHMAVFSSLKILEASVTSSQAFCFQRWFLSLRARVLENLVGVLRALREVSLNVAQNFNQVEIESSDKLQCLKSYQDITQASLQLFRLVEEFDLLRASFIGMDSETSAVLAAHGLSCSILAFATAFGVSNIDQHSQRILIGGKTSNLQALTIQSLRRLFWSVDHETRASFSLLLNYFHPNENCLSPLPSYQNWNIGYKDREVLNVCSYAISGAVRLFEKIAPQFTENALSLTFNTLMKWMHIHFRLPRYFFKVRPFIGSKLFVHNKDSSNGVDISVSQGSHLTLNICLQLKNVPPKLLVKSTKLYCILHVPCGQRQAPGNSHSGYEAWKDDEIVEMNQKLFCLVLDSAAGKRRIGMRSRGHESNGIAVWSIVKIPIGASFLSTQVLYFLLQNPGLANLGLSYRKVSSSEAIAWSCIAAAGIRGVQSYS
ncbi:hypothetical protein JHK87_052258 [Glycine soja]|nr:hypothetical protein JHK87_052258 [Glycine soja]